MTKTSIEIVFIIVVHGIMVRKTTVDQRRYISCIGGPSFWGRNTEFPIQIYINIVSKQWQNQNLINIFSLKSLLNNSFTRIAYKSKKKYHH